MQIAHRIRVLLTEPTGCTLTDSSGCTFVGKPLAVRLSFHGETEKRQLSPGERVCFAPVGRQAGRPKAAQDPALTDD